MTSAIRADQADRRSAPTGGRSAEWLVIGGLTALGAVLTWYVHLAASKPGLWSLPLDLTVYRDAGLIARHARPLYDPHLASPLLDWPGPPGFAGVKFIYPPFAALPFALMSYLPLRVLDQLATVTDVLALLLATWVTFGALGHERGQRRAGLTMLVTAVVLLTEPVQRTIYLGQVELVLMALVWWDMSQPDKRRWKGAGVGLAAGIKLVPLIFIPYLLLTRRFRQAAVAAAVFAATVGIGFAVLPADSSQWWLHGLFLRGSYGANTSYAGNQSLLALIARSGGSAAHAEWLAAAAITGIIGLAVAVMLDRAGKSVLGILTCALTGLLASPISWDHHWVWIVLAVPVLVHYALAARGAARWGLAGLAVLVVAIFAAWPTSWWGETSDPSGWDRGLIWAPPNGADLEMGWHGWQLVAGNAYLLSGLALLMVLTGTAVVTSRRSVDWRADRR